MKPLTSEWLAKANADFKSACREMRARKDPNYDAACFFVQQCVEKHLKARLQQADMHFGKTHNLVALLDLVSPVEPMWETLRQQLQELTRFAVRFRYPGESATKDQAREAVKRCQAILGIIGPDRWQT